MNGRTSTARVYRRYASPRAPRALVAAAASILCFAAMHVLVRLVDGGLHRDAGFLNVFTMLEVQRLWPAVDAGPAAACASLVFALAVYGTVYATMTRPLHVVVARRVAAHPTSEAGPRRNGVAANGHANGVRLFVPAESHAGLRVPPLAGFLALAAGLGVHMSALALIEQFVHVFPPLPDVVHAHLPYVDFGWPGEIVYAAFLVTATIVLFRTQKHTVPAILTMLGVFYAVRGVFLFLMPIGIPPTAPPLASRFVFWPFPGHAYFPGGHTGMMTVISLSVISRPWRRALLAITFAFAIGTLLARTHYAADALGGWLVAYSIVLWGRRHFSLHARPRTRVEAQKMAAARQAAEVYS
jgi:hypothetical protein